VGWPAFSFAAEQKLNGREIHPELWFDGDIDPAEIADELLSAFDEMEPWGRGRAFGAIWFRALAPGDEELPIPDERLRLLYTPAWNWWKGERRVQIIVEGIARV